MDLGEDDGTLGNGGFGGSDAPVLIDFDGGAGPPAAATAATPSSPVIHQQHQPPAFQPALKYVTPNPGPAPGTAEAFYEPNYGQYQYNVQHQHQHQQQHQHAVMVNPNVYVDAQTEKQTQQFIHDVRQQPVMQRIWMLFPYYRNYSIPWYNGTFFSTTALVLFCLVVACVALACATFGIELVYNTRTGLTYSGTIIGAIIGGLALVCVIQYSSNYPGTSKRHQEIITTAIVVTVVIMLLGFIQLVIVNTKYSDVRMINELSFGTVTVVPDSDDDDNRHSDDDDDGHGGHDRGHGRRHRDRPCKELEVSLNNEKHIGLKPKVEAFLAQQSVMTYFVATFPIVLMVSIRAAVAHFVPESAESSTNFLSHSTPHDQQPQQHQQQQHVQQQQHYDYQYQPQQQYQQQHQNYDAMYQQGGGGGGGGLYVASQSHGPYNV